MHNYVYLCSAMNRREGSDGLKLCTRIAFCSVRD